MRRRFARFAGRLCEARVIDPISPGLVHEQFCGRREAGNVCRQPRGVGTVGRGIVALKAGLLDRDVVLLIRPEFIPETAAVCVKAFLCSGICFEHLRSGRVQLKRRAAHDDGAMDEGVTVRFCEIIEVVGRVPREAVADGKKPHHANLGLRRESR